METMTENNIVNDEQKRNLGLAMKRGALGQCPHCGEGKLFKSFLKPVSNCDICNEDYTHQLADDLPAYLTVVIVGHIIVAIFMALENITTLSLWGHLAILTPVTIIMCLVMLQPIKGATIGLQWANKMHGFK